MVQNILDRGAAWLTAQFKQNVSEVIHYQRGTASTELDATPGRTEFEETTTDGFVITFESRDFIIDSRDLELDDGGPTRPKQGDRISQIRGEHEYIYEVMAFGGSEQPYRFADPNGRSTRIHTKEVEVKPA